MQMANNVIKSTFFIIAIALLCKIFGFCRELMLAKYFGTGQIVDIYLMSIAIPSILFGFLPAIGVGVTAIYYQVERNLRNAFISIAMLISVCIALTCIVVTYFNINDIVQLCARGFDKNSMKTTIKFLQVTIWAIVFIAPIQILTSYLNCNTMYMYSNMSNLVISLGQIIGIIIAYYCNIYLLPYSYIVPLFIQTVVLLYFSNRSNFRLNIKGDLGNYLKKLCMLTLPIFISNILVDINGFVGKYLASGLLPGCISALNYAFILQTVFFTICSTIISTIFYPRVAKLVTLSDRGKLATEVCFVANGLIFLCMPLSIISIIYAEEIVKVVYMRGHFNANSLNLTYIPFAIYSGSLVFIVLRDFIIKVLYAHNDSKSNTIYSTLTILINIVASIALIKPLGHVGLAWGTTLSATLTIPLYIKKMSKIVFEHSINHDISSVKKIFVASGVIGALAMLCKYLETTLGIKNTPFCTIWLTVNILILLIIYIVVLKLIKFAELEIIIRYIKRSL